MTIQWGILFFLLGSIIWIAWVNIYPYFFMKPIGTGMVNGTEIVTIKNYVINLFLIKSEDGYIMIDTGMRPTQVKKRLQQLGIKPEEIKHVFLTHTDFDHMGALKLFSEAQIYLNAEEWQMIDRRTKRTAFTYNKLPKEISRDQYVLLHHGERLDLAGHQIIGMSVPGHTMGSMMYLLDGQYLFSGDAFQVVHGKLKVHPFSMNKQLAAQTIRSLKTDLHQEQYVFTAHYGVYIGAQLNG